MPASVGQGYGVLVAETRLPNEWEIQSWGRVSGWMDGGEREEEALREEGKAG